MLLVSSKTTYLLGIYTCSLLYLLPRDFSATKTYFCLHTNKMVLLFVLCNDQYKRFFYVKAITIPIYIVSSLKQLIYVVLPPALVMFLVKFDINCTKDTITEPKSFLIIDIESKTA